MTELGSFYHFFAHYTTVLFTNLNKTGCNIADIEVHKPILALDIEKYNYFLRKVS